MGQLTSSIKSYRGTTVTSGIILDNGSDAVFPHRGQNLHHIIYVDPAASAKVSIQYSLDGTNFFTVFTAATNADNVYWDTGRSLPPALPGTTALGSGGGSVSCPPSLVKITVASGALAVLDVLTYGTTVR
jgi:hypothetical protein